MACKGGSIAPSHVALQKSLHVGRLPGTTIISYVVVVGNDPILMALLTEVHVLEEVVSGFRHRFHHLHLKAYRTCSSVRAQDGKSTSVVDRWSSGTETLHVVRRSRTTCQEFATSSILYAYLGRAITCDNIAFLVNKFDSDIHQVVLLCRNALLLIHQTHVCGLSRSLQFKALALNLVAGSIKIDHLERSRLVRQAESSPVSVTWHTLSLVHSVQIQANLRSATVYIDRHILTLASRESPALIFELPSPCVVERCSRLHSHSHRFLSPHNVAIVALRLLLTNKVDVATPSVEIRPTLEHARSGSL